MALIIGLTGGIGSGKSTLAAQLEALGAGLVDTDAVAHRLTQVGGAAIDALREAFGAEAIDAEGQLDRAWMRRRAFTDPAAKARLEAILHPMIRAEVEHETSAKQAAGAPYVVLAVPLLVESGDWRSRVSRVLVVDCSEESQIARVLTRPGMSEDMARAILEVQAPRDARLAAADDLVFNESSLGDLAAHAKRLHAFYCDLAATV